MSKIEEIFLYDPTIEARLRDVGVIPKRIAIEYSAQGPTARGSGVKKDVRYNEKLGVYPDLGVKPITPKEFTGVIKGDVFDRMVVRVGELWQSLDIIEQGRDGPAKWKAREPTFPNLFAVARALVGEQVADIPVAIASIDPCLSCTDRVAIVDAETGKKKILTEEDLLRESYKKTKEINPKLKIKPERIGVGCMRGGVL